MKFKNLLLIILCFFITFTSFGADCTVTVSSSSSVHADQACVQQNGFIGQAFVPCETGMWRSLQFNIPVIFGTGTFTLYIANGEIADKTKAVKSFGPYTSAGVITESPNLPVTAGQKMIFWIELTGFSQVCFNCSNTIPTGGEASDFVHSALVGGAPNPDGSGSLTTRGNVSSSRFTPHAALAFVAVIDATPIPTLSQWGLVIFSLLIMNLGLFFVNKKESIITLR